MRRYVGAGVAAALLVTGGLVGTGTAVAAGDPTFFFDPVTDKVLMPGEGWAELSPQGTGGQNDGRPDGTYVYALSRKPLTDAGWSGGGVPDGLKVDPTESCKEKAGTPGVYLCDIREWINPAPQVSALGTAANGTTAYYGLVYVPRGGSVDAGVKEAQTAAAKPVGPRRAHASITVRTKEHVAGNTLSMWTPALPAGGSVRHVVKLRAVDKGVLWMGMTPVPGFRHWDEGELDVTVTGVSVADTSGASGGATCDHVTGEVGGGDVRCEIGRPGEYKVSYTLKAGSGTAAWRLRNRATYEVYTFGTGNPEKTSDFAVTSTVPVAERFRLLGRNASGELYEHRGTGKAAEPFAPAEQIGWGFDWNQYSALTRLGPVTVQSTGPGAVARDRNGVLWFYRASGDGAVYEDRLKVGGGWNAYDALTGASDLTGDKRADLLARDTTGTLWLYPGTGNPWAPFGTRVKAGTGWNAYDMLVDGTDLTGDGKADLVTRDTAGKLWLHPGTGTAAAPFGVRAQIGTNWRIYNAVVAPGDLNSDGRADLVARDASGTLWYYQGTGNAAKPYLARVKAGTGFQGYGLLF
ncbi:FG-GAP repeat domain-containing protein [Streptomyces sp. NPDC012888]|uniref:FG-GAP repeat domain-containing protein n=1 Tax=Streptomyces sp. NPDC012888 TaxID=3364855 RepID=UPI0036900C6A